MRNKLQTYYWVGKVLALDNHSDGRSVLLHDILSGSINWDLFFRICDFHLMLPAIYLKFRNNELLSSIPEELASHLAGIYKLNQERNRNILRQINEINTLLSKYEISPVYLKGAGHLIDGLYEDIGERFMFDIDFIVADDKFLMARDILEQDGYAVMKPYDADNRFTMKHYPRMDKSGAAAGIEVHRLLSEIQYTRHFDFDMIDQEKKVPANSFPGCFVLSNRHKIIHNLINWQLSDKGHYFATGSFRQMYDLFLLSGEADANKSLKEFGHFRKQARCYLTLTYRIFGVSGKLGLIDRFTSLGFIFRHDMNIRYQWWFKLSMAILQYDRTFRYAKGYAGNLKRAFFDATYRREVIKRRILREH